MSHLIVDCRKAVADAQALAPPQDAQHYIAEVATAKAKADQLQARVRELTQELADTDAVVAEQRHTLEEADKACKAWQETTASLKEVPGVGRVHSAGAMHRPQSRVVDRAPRTDSNVGSRCVTWPTGWIGSSAMSHAILTRCPMAAKCCGR